MKSNTFKREEIRGKTLKEWKAYCETDKVPIKTMKYISCLEEQIKVGKAMSDLSKIGDKEAER
jgi:hypothetical protein